jgi:hypothetical protein
MSGAAAYALEQRKPVVTPERLAGIHLWGGEDRRRRVMRARSEPVRAFSTKDEAVRFAGRQLGGHYAVYHKDRKIWPTP